jgi:methionyl-tRNA formyltransferase
MEENGEGIELAGLLTNCDACKGRSGQPAASELSAAAIEIDKRRAAKGFLPIRQVKVVHLKAPEREEVSALKPDLLVSFACGHIFGPRFLALFPLGGVNIHPSLLPRYRGPTPIPAAILAGDSETGVTIQTIALEVDAGDILAVERVALTGRETTESLSDTASEIAAALLPGVLKNYAAGRAEKTPQRGETSYCHFLAKDDGFIDWKKSAASIDAQIRAYTPWPLSFTTCGGTRLYLLEASPYNGEVVSPEAGLAGDEPGFVIASDKNAGILVRTGEGVLAVTRLQFQAKKPLFWKDFLNGARGFLCKRLGE